MKTGKDSKMLKEVKKLYPLSDASKKAQKGLQKALKKPVKPMKKDGK